MEDNRRRRLTPPIYDLRITNYDLDFSALARGICNAQALVMGKIKGVFL